MNDDGPGDGGIEREIYGISTRRWAAGHCPMKEESIMAENNEISVLKKKPSRSESRWRKLQQKPRG